ncbi:MAG: cell division protein [Spirochaetae bacterium HGW-Spirochaetae-1]|jgi:Rod binding domain-containing protein|nr:MAG: cell division protein [Spirochaetae bacterium HGW-Spirochaetae-1]
MIDTTMLQNQILDSARGNRDAAFKEKAERAAGKKDFQETLRETVELQKSDAGGKKVVDKKLMDVCVEMESLFVAKMMKEMRSTVHKTGWIHGGFAEDIFEDMLYDKYSLEMSKNANLGLATMLYKEMSSKI